MPATAEIPGALANVRGCNHASGNSTGFCDDSRNGDTGAAAGANGSHGVQLKRTHDRHGKQHRHGRHHGRHGGDASHCLHRNADRSYTSGYHKKQKELPTSRQS